MATINNYSELLTHFNNIEITFLEFKDIIGAKYEELEIIKLSALDLECKLVGIKASEDSKSKNTSSISSKMYHAKRVITLCNKIISSRNKLDKRNSVIDEMTNKIKYLRSELHHLKSNTLPAKNAEIKILKSKLHKSKESQ